VRRRTGVGGVRSGMHRFDKRGEVRVHISLTGLFQPYVRHACFKSCMN
jgi:hypothetical protein